jgi:AbrB family looped-hinge helix DNA binding protein
MTTRIKVGTNREIAIPEEAMRSIGIGAGSELLLDVRDGYLVLVPEAKKTYVERHRGLHAEVWDGVDPQEYIRREREGWTESI